MNQNTFYVLLSIGSIISSLFYILIILIILFLTVKLVKIFKTINHGFKYLSDIKEMIKKIINN